MKPRGIANGDALAVHDEIPVSRFARRAFARLRRKDPERRQHDAEQRSESSRIGLHQQPPHDFGK